MSLPGLNLRVGPGLLPLAADLSAVWDMACHSHKADVCLNCQKETKTTLWDVEGWEKKIAPSFIYRGEKKKGQITTARGENISKLDAMRKQTIL